MKGWPTVKELHYNRKRAKSMAEREAAGESLWTDEFSKPVRVKVQNFVELLDENGEARETASLLLRHGLGLRHLISGRFNARYECLQYIGTCPDEIMPSVIEAIHQGFAEQPWNQEHLETYDRFINELLSFERISYELVEGQMIEKQSQELHAEVVAPALTLLSHRGELAEVEAAYQKALERLSQGDHGGALTSAATALQEMLEARGCKGKTLGEQAKEAKRLELLASGDSPLLAGIQKVLDWASGVRNTRSDAHQVSDVGQEEAWLMVHIVGALILRLAHGTGL